MKIKMMVTFLFVIFLNSLLPIYTFAADTFTPGLPCDADKVTVYGLDSYAGGGYHNGIDLTPTVSANFYQDIYAIEDGVVYAARNSCSHEFFDAYHACPDTWGNYISIMHTVNGETYFSVYAHLKYNSISVNSGDYVSKGQKIAQMGTSGGSTGYHLHLEIWKGAWSDKNSKNSISFDYYRDNPGAIAGLTFLPGLADNSARYGDWIKENCTLNSDVYTCTQQTTTPDYLNQCSQSDTSIDVEITKRTTLKSLPCSKGTSAESEDVYTCSPGEVFYVDEIIYNTAGNYWYRTTYNGEICYMYAGDTTVKKLYDAVDLKGVVAPTKLNVGERFSIQGEVSCPDTYLNRVSAKVIDANGNTVLNAVEEVTGGSTLYRLLNSAIDYALTFNELAEGHYTYCIYGSSLVYYVENNSLVPVTNHLLLHQSDFTVGNPGEIDISVDEYLKLCTRYDSYNYIKFTDYTDFMTFPCEKWVNGNSECIYTSYVGEIVPVYAVYSNTVGERWYETVHNGQACYFRTTFTELHEARNDATFSGWDITFMNEEGNDIPLGGTIKSEKTELKAVYLNIIDDYTGEYVACVADGLLEGTHEYNLKNSSIDERLRCDKLPEGWYTVELLVEEKQYFEHIEVLSEAENVVLVYQAAFVVAAKDEPKDEPSTPFIDIDDHWGKEAIEFVYEKNLMDGVADEYFDPTGTANRAMLVTILWRLDGQPIVNSRVGFSDVKSSAWYYDAVRWAAANGIVDGYEDGTFRATQPITREQMATIFYRYVISKNWSWPVKNINPYIAKYEYSAWAENGVFWAESFGLFDKIGASMSNLKKTTDRAEMASCLMQYIVNP